MQHKMWEITLDDKLHLAPIDPSLEQVLDIGTGNGKRVIDFGSTPHFFPKT
jgi:16S rRNA G527 N7-methylase RsmG